VPVPGGSSFIYKNDWRAGDAEERCQLSPVDAKKFFSFFRVGGYRRDAEVTKRSKIYIDKADYEALQVIQGHG